MVESMKLWWQAHGAGERWLMGLLGAAALIVLLWLGVWRPVSDGLASSWAQQSVALDRNAAVRAAVIALKAQPAAAAQSGPPVPIDQLVGQTAAEAGFTLDRTAGQGPGRLSVNIGSARMSALLGWLTRLETAGVHVQTIAIVPAATDGTVSVQAVLMESQR